MELRQPQNNHKKLWFSLVIFLLVSKLALASTEAVYVQKVTNDNAIIIRTNGDAYLIEKGVGCLSLYRYEGKTVFINSLGMFLGVSSNIILPDSNQKCRIWDSKYLGVSNIRRVAYNEGCLQESFIVDKTDDGSIIALSNGTVWEIDSIFRIQSSLWLPSQNVLACNNNLLNVNDGQKVNARRIK